ncbi:hypothetical protein P691DRAFT_630537, partial [Macrolepiota fuliginosa MF-IS2]
LITCSILGTIAETHKVHFTNKCGSGIPMLIQGPNVLPRGPDFTANGPLKSAIAFFRSSNCSHDFNFIGKCGFDSDGYTLVELALINPDAATPGSLSTADISLIPPRAFPQPTSFRYVGNATYPGSAGNDANCPAALRKPEDTQVQVA